MSDGSVKGFGSVYLREPEQLRTGYGLGRAGVRLLFRGLRAQGFAVGAQRFLEVVDRGYDVGFRFGRSIVVRAVTLRRACAIMSAYLRMSSALRFSCILTSHFRRSP